MSNQPMIEVWGARTMRTLRPLWVLEELGLPYHLAPMGPETRRNSNAGIHQTEPQTKDSFPEGRFGQVV